MLSVNRIRPTASIADMDGTLVNISSARHHVMKNPKDFDAFHAASIDCPPHPEAIQWCIERQLLGDTILVVTARMEKWCDLSSRWLYRDLVPVLPDPRRWDGPFMRRDGDIRPDIAIKREIYRYLKRHYDIRAAIDDNPAIVGLWTEIGIPVTVQPGWDTQYDSVKTSI
jgi:hypothetical protein